MILYEVVLIIFDGCGSAVPISNSNGWVAYLQIDPICPILLVCYALFTPVDDKIINYNLSTHHQTLFKKGKKADRWVDFIKANTIANKK